MLWWNGVGELQACSPLTTMKYQDQSNLGWKGFVLLTLPYCCSSLKEVSTGTQTWQKQCHFGEELQTGASIVVIEGCCLLACFPWLSQSAFLFNLGSPAQWWSCAMFNASLTYIPPGMFIIYLWQNPWKSFSVAFWNTWHIFFLSIVAQLIA